MLGNKEYPKVLIIDPTPFNRNRNNGIVKSNIFEGWPKDRLAQVDYSNMQPSFDVCEKYWRLRKWDILKGFFGVSQAGELPTPQKIASNIYDPNYAFEYEDRPKIERKLSFLSPQVRTIVGEVILRLPSVLSDALLRWIAEFNPDVIFSVLSTGPIVRLVVKVSQSRNIPIVPYFTDDWVTTLYDNQKFSWLLRQSLLKWFHECLARSPIRLTPNNFMSMEYFKRYGGRFEPMLYPEEIKQPVKKSCPSHGSTPVRFLYIGGLTPHRWVGLRQIGDALNSLRKEGVNGELQIYTFPTDIQKHGESLTLYPVMRVMGTAKPENVAQLQGDADVLVHVESFDQVYQKWTALSLSTKIPQYMMAGACILAYGPENVASMKHLIDSSAALTVGKEDAATLRSSLQRLIKDKELRQLLGKKAHNFAIEYHEASKQRELFRNYVVEARNQWTKNRDQGLGYV